MAKRLTLGSYLTDSQSWADCDEEVPDHVPETQPSARASGRKSSDSGPPPRERGYSPRRGDRDDYGSRPVSSDYQPHPQQDIPDRPPFTCFIGNLSYQLEEEDIRDFFRDCEVVSIRIPMDYTTGRKKGFGYVEFADRESLVRALALSNVRLFDREIRIDIAAERAGGQRGDRRGGYGFDNRGGGDSYRYDRGDGGRGGDRYDRRYDRGERGGYDRRDDRGGFERGDRGGFDRREDRGGGFDRRDSGGYDQGRRFSRQERPHRESIGEEPPTDHAEPPKERPKLKLLKKGEGKAPTTATDKGENKERKVSIFGAGRPQDVSEYEKKKRQMEEQRKKKEEERKKAEEAAQTLEEEAVGEKGERGREGGRREARRDSQRGGEGEMKGPIQIKKRPERREEEGEAASPLSPALEEGGERQAGRGERGQGPAGRQGGRGQERPRREKSEGVERREGGRGGRGEGGRGGGRGRGTGRRSPPVEEEGGRSGGRGPRPERRETDKTKKQPEGESADSFAPAKGGRPVRKPAVVKEEPAPATKSLNAFDALNLEDSDEE